MIITVIGLKWYNKPGIEAVGTPVLSAAIRTLAL